MKMKTLLFSGASLFAATSMFALTPAPDTVIVSSAIGQLEKTINSDTTAKGARTNPNRVYELKADSIYIQQSPIVVSNLGGILQIIGKSGGSKPVWLKVQNNGVAVGINSISGGLKLQNIEYENTETAGVLPQTSFNLTGKGSHFIVDNCLVEGCNLEWGDVDGVPVGAEVRVTNSYFRDFNDFSQWWAGRVMEMKVPIDTFIVENNTFTGGGLTFLSQNDLTEYAFINHNTFINNTKYPFLCQYWKECYFTNNLFVNANWVGEDSINVATGGQDPDGRVGHAMYEGIFGVDTIIARQIAMNPKFWVNGDTGKLVDGLALNEIKVYAADNIVVSSPALEPYYNGSADATLVGAGNNMVNGKTATTPLSFLGWNSSPAYPAPFPVMNIPGIWENWRATHIEGAFPNVYEHNNSIYQLKVSDLGFADPMSTAAAAEMIPWNQVQWSVTGAALPASYSAIVNGDGDATTFPGLDASGKSTENGVVGITKVSDLKENFAVATPILSTSDKLEIGSLQWNNQDYNSASSTAAVKAAYQAGLPTAINPVYSNVNVIRAFPNPTSGILNLTQVASIKIYNMEGQLVIDKLNVSQINMSGLPSGLYIGVINNSTTTKIVLK